MEFSNFQITLRYFMPYIAFNISVVSEGKEYPDCPVKELLINFLLSPLSHLTDNITEYFFCEPNY